LTHYRCLRNIDTLSMFHMIPKFEYIGFCHFSNVNRIEFRSAKTRHFCCIITALLARSRKIFALMSLK